MREKVSCVISIRKLKDYKNENAVLVMLLWLTVSIRLDNDRRIIVSSPNRVTTSYWSATIGMSSILCISARVPRRLSAVCVRRVIKLPSFNIFVCFLIFSERQPRFVWFVRVATALIIIAPVAFVVEWQRPVKAVFALEVLKIREDSKITKWKL